VTVTVAGIETQSMMLPNTIGWSSAIPELARRALIEGSAASISVACGPQLTLATRTVTASEAAATTLLTGTSRGATDVPQREVTTPIRMRSSRRALRLR
jgi:hypothetical protein